MLVESSGSTWGLISRVSSGTLVARGPQRFYAPSYEIDLVEMFHRDRDRSFDCSSVIQILEFELLNDSHLWRAREVLTLIHINASSEWKPGQKTPGGPPLSFR